MRVAHRFSNQVNGKPGPYQGLTVLRPKTAKRPGVDWSGRVRLVPEALGEPLRWRKPQRVFVNSMSDLFHEGLTNEEIASVFAVMAAAPHHTFQVLTKRPRRALEWFSWVQNQHGDEGTLHARVTCYLSAARAERATALVDHQQALRPPWPEGGKWPLPNAWLGVSCENQETADERIPLLLQCPATVRFVSAEPLLGPLDLRSSLERWRCKRCGAERGRGEWATRFGVMQCGACMPHGCIVDQLQRAPALDWVIVGGESGSGARPFHVDWARSIVEQCAAAHVPCFVKQLGARPFRAAGEDETDWGPTARGSEYDAFDQPGEVRLDDRKGGDMSEWPKHLRVRQFPTNPGEQASPKEP
jgi:protein gp37